MTRRVNVNAIRKWVIMAEGKPPDKGKLPRMRLHLVALRSEHARREKEPGPELYAIGALCNRLLRLISEAMNAP